MEAGNMTKDLKISESYIVGGLIFPKTKTSLCSRLAVSTGPR